MVDTSVVITVPTVPSPEAVSASSPAPAVDSFERVEKPDPVLNVGDAEVAQLLRDARRLSVSSPEPESAPPPAIEFPDALDAPDASATFLSAPAPVPAPASAAVPVAPAPVSAASTQIADEYLSPSDFAAPSPVVPSSVPAAMPADLPAAAPVETFTIPLGGAVLPGDVGIRFSDGTTLTPEPVAVPSAPTAPASEYSIPATTLPPGASTDYGDEARATLPMTSAPVVAAPAPSAATTSELRPLLPDEPVAAPAGKPAPKRPVDRKRGDGQPSLLGEGFF